MMRLAALWSALILVFLAFDRAPAQPPPNAYGAYTQLSGFYDLQSIGNPCQYIRYNRRTGYLHAIFQISTDSLNPIASSRTAYAYSRFGGFVWNACNHVLGNRHTDLPSLDLVSTSTWSYPVVVNHNVDSTAQTGMFFADSEGTCMFYEVSSPGLLAALTLPDVAACAEGSVIVVASTPQTGILYIFRTNDFLSWSPPVQIQGVSSSFYTAQASDSGQVGIVYRNADESIGLIQSTDNGISWGAPTEIIPPRIILGSDTLVTYLGADLVYRGNTPAVAVTVTKKRGAQYSHRDACIGFWTPGTGFRIAVPHNIIPGLVDTLNRPQAYHLTMGYPSIGVSNNTLVIAFQAFRAETSAAGFNYSDVYSTYSGNGGASWSTPIYLTNTPHLDERYPSVSKWNGPGEPYILWQEDPEPGSHIADGAPLSRCRQEMFTFIDLPVREDNRNVLPERAALLQNYPNPFNPTTEVGFRIADEGFVSLKVYDVLGREIATLVNEVKKPGTYIVQWNAVGMASGVYFCRFRSGGFTSARKLLLLR